MTTSRHPSWDTISAALMAQEPRRFPLHGHPDLYLHMEPGTKRLSLMVPWDSTAEPPVSPLRELSFAQRTIDGESLLAVGMNTPSLHHECYSFLLTVADTIQLEGVAPEAALARELEAWEALLRPAPRVSKEEETGLIGELWVLHRMIGSMGASAVSAWVAGEPESHDFRFCHHDLEVKTTTARERRHIVNDPSQVTPLPGHDLWFASLQVAPAGLGGGRTLPESIAKVMKLLAAEGTAQSRFQSILSNRGYRTSDAPQYTTRFELRTKPQLVPVGQGFPALTRTLLEEALGVERAGRVPSLTYVVRLDGLGYGDGTEPFLALLPSSGTEELL